MSDTLIIILLAAAVTFLIRCAGYFVLARFETLPPRVEAGLNAVPAAVLTAIVAPVAAKGGLSEFVTLAFVLIMTLRGVSGGLVFLSGALLLILMRTITG